MTMKRFIGTAVIFLICGVLHAQNMETLTVTVGGDSVEIVNGLVIENCASRFAVGVRVNGNDISVFERDTVVQKMRCICEYAISAVLRNLQPDPYTAEVYREYLKAFSYPSDTTVFIGNITFVVPDGASGVFGFSNRQTDCQNSAATPLPGSPLRLTISPNPCTSQTVLSYSLETPSPVTIEVCDIRGKIVHRTDAGMMSPGTQSVAFPSESFPSAGMYVCRVVAGDKSGVAALFLVK